MQRNRTRSWLGVNWMRHTGLPGKGTASAVCSTYHKNALGHGSGADVTSDIIGHGDRAAPFVNHLITRKSVGWGKSVTASVASGGRRIIKQNKRYKKKCYD